MNRCSKRSFGMKLIGLMTAAIMLLACCMPAFAAESETRTNTESFQLLTYSEDSASMGSGWTWEITLRIRSISLSATECMVFNPMETVYSCIKNPVRHLCKPGKRKLFRRRTACNRLESR